MLAEAQSRSHSLENIKPIKIWDCDASLLENRDAVHNRTLKRTHTIARARARAHKIARATVTKQPIVT